MIVTGAIGAEGRVVNNAGLEVAEVGGRQNLPGGGFEVEDVYGLVGSGDDGGRLGVKRASGEELKEGPASESVHEGPVYRIEVDGMRPLGLRNARFSRGPRIATDYAGGPCNGGTTFGFRGVRAGFGGCALARDAPWAAADSRWQSGLGQDLFLAGIRKSKIARRLKIDRTSVRRPLEEKKS